MTENVRLGDLIRPSGRRAREDVGLPVYSVTKHRGFVPSREYFKKQVFAKDLSDYKVVASGDFAYATIHLDEGSIGVAPEDALVSPMYTVFAADRTVVDTGYLIRFLKSPIAVSSYSQLGRGTAERRKSISLEALGRIALRLPPLPDQVRISALLDQADDLRKADIAALALLNELERSYYFKLIGDPTQNPRGWKRRPLSELGQVVTGNTPSRSNGDLQNSSIEWIKSTNIVTDLSFLTAADERLFGDELKSARIVPAGSVLVTCIAGSASSIGNASLANRRVAFNQQINAFVPFTYPPRFALAHIRAAKSLVQAASTGGMQSLVSKSRFQSIEIPDPPAELVAKFEAFSVELDVQRGLIRRHAEANDGLFDSLQSWAFRAIK